MFLRQSWAGANETWVLQIDYVVPALVLVQPVTTAFATQNRVVARTSVQNISIGSRICFEIIIACLTEESVAATASVQPVVVQSTVELIITASTKQMVAS